MRLCSLPSRKSDKQQTLNEQQQKQCEAELSIQSCDFIISTHLTFSLDQSNKKTAEFPRIEEKQRSEKKKKQRRQQEKQQQQRVCVNALEETRRCGRTYQKRAEQSLPKRAEQHKFH